MISDRRRFLGAAASAVVTTGATVQRLRPKHFVNYRRPRSLVAVLSCHTYSEKMEDLILDGLNVFPIHVRGKSVLLKPNLVEDLPGPVNTNPVLLGAAGRAFLRMGASHVVIGEGPGHQRDTELVVHAAGLDQILRDPRITFADLNRDELRKVQLKADYSGLRELWLPRTALAADIIVSMPKMKTHHWAGVTLSLKNMFGIVPGMKYGWPKNLLHWAGIHESILDICATVPIHFVIADGIMAMEGNGPLQGSPRDLGKIVLSDDAVAADATCARLMGLEPIRVKHIQMAGGFLGNLDERAIEMRGEGMPSPSRRFDVLPAFSYLLHRSG